MDRNPWQCTSRDLFIRPPLAGPADDQPDQDTHSDDSRHDRQQTDHQQNDQFRYANAEHGFVARPFRVLSPAEISIVANSLIERKSVEQFAAIAIGPRFNTLCQWPAPTDD